jgi:methylmalonyl-CoA/ethylmalonyl-CoA epimerase
MKRFSRSVTVIENVLHTKSMDFPIDHIGIAVHDLEIASAPYQALGFQVLGHDELVANQHVMVRAFQAGESLIELLAPTSTESSIAGFLEKRGQGMHHIAFRVEHLEGEIARLEQIGAQFISSVPRVGRAGTRVVFLKPSWGQGVLMELVEHTKFHAKI